MCIRACDVTITVFYSYVFTSLTSIYCINFMSIHAHDVNPLYNILFIYIDMRDAYLYAFTSVTSKVKM